jgi:FAD synthase
LLDDPSASVETIENEIGMSIYPNPTSNNATVTFNLANASDVLVNVTDLSGKVAQSIDLGSVNGAQNVNINVDTLSNGVYMVNVNVNGVVSTQKLVVRK